MCSIYTQQDTEGGVTDQFLQVCLSDGQMSPETSLTVRHEQAHTECVPEGLFSPEPERYHVSALSELVLTEHEPTRTPQLFWLVILLADSNDQLSCSYTERGCRIQCGKSEEVHFLRA